MKDLTLEAVEEMADSILAHRNEENTLKKKIVSAMRRLKINELKTAQGKVQLVEDRNLMKMNKVRLKKILCKRFGLKPEEIKKALVACHDSTFQPAHVAVWFGARYAKAKVDKAA